MSANMKFNRQRMLMGGAYRPEDIMKVPVVFKNPEPKVGESYSPTANGIFGTGGVGAAPNEEEILRSLKK